MNYCQGFMIFWALTALFGDALAKDKHTQENTPFKRITQTVNQYFEGIHQGNEAKLRQAFHPSARVIGHYAGKTTDQSFEEFLAFVGTLTTDASKGLPLQKWIISMDITGPQAVVRTRVRSGEFWFNDVLVLVHDGSGWKIRFKAFNDAIENRPPKR